MSAFFRLCRRIYPLRETRERASCFLGLGFQLDAVLLCGWGGVVFSRALDILVDILHQVVRIVGFATFRVYVYVDENSSLRPT